MSALLTIQSRSHAYTVEGFGHLAAALGSLPSAGLLCLVDKTVYELYRPAFDCVIPAEKVFSMEATEGAKSLSAVEPVFAWVLEKGLRRNGCVAVVGGGVMQDIGCFVASVLFRGVRWELVPTTLLSQCDSCIGSKSSLNFREWKNQLGTFYAPHRVLLTTSVLATLPTDEIRSGIGEAIKLHLLAGETEFRRLMGGLSTAPGDLMPWILSSLKIKQPFVEEDEFDQGRRNLLNYGHTFAHSYESATQHAIPHGIAVTLGVVTATYLSSRLGLVGRDHYQEIATALRPWYTPYGGALQRADFGAMIEAIKKDKKNTQNSINCVLTRGFGRMEKMPVDLEKDLRPILAAFLEKELS